MNAISRFSSQIIRALDSLQLTAYQGVAIPANWTKGQDVVILPSVTDAEAKRLFPEGVRKETNYLRYVADPSLRAMKRHSFRGLAKSVVAMQRWGSNIADREVQVCEPASVLDIGPDNYGPDEEEGLKEEGEKDCGKIEEE